MHSNDLFKAHNFICGKVKSECCKKSIENITNDLHKNVLIKKYRKDIQSCHLANNSFEDIDGHHQHDMLKGN
jgi:hypothetical protein